MSVKPDNLFDSAAGDEATGKDKAVWSMKYQGSSIKDSNSCGQSLKKEHFILQSQLYDIY